MGYISKDIAVITEPKILTLSSSPNFVQFASKPATRTKLHVNVTVNALPTTPSLSTATVLILTEPAGPAHSFHGTTNPELVGGPVFYVSVDKSDTAENLRQALLADKWISANFDIVIPFTWVGATSTNGTTIELISKGTGAEFNIGLTAPNNTANVAYTIDWINALSVNGDSISGETSTASIELDVYTDAPIFLGEDDRPINAEALGNFAITLQKTYSGTPLWFELNALFSQYAGFTIPPTVAGWFNTGTARVYRFIANRRSINSYSFYQSNALFVINGYGPVFEELDLGDYAYMGAKVKLLTNKPRTPYIKGQKEYLNFIMHDARHSYTDNNYTVRVAYRAYSTSDVYLGTIFAHPKTRTALSIVNTCALNIDAVLAAYPKAGIIRVALCRGTALLSNDLEYIVRPEALHKLQQFTFLNRLGGWDAFNFDATTRDEIKPSGVSYNKTFKPGAKRGDSLETVYDTSLANTITIEGAPVTDEVAQWLKELAASRVILDTKGNYIIIEDFTLQISAQAKNMQVPTIKYRLSETFTND